MVRTAVAFLLLVMAAAHAVVPADSPFERKAGSAFSVATEDVSLRAGVSADVSFKAAALEPPTLIAVPLPTPPPRMIVGASLPETRAPPAAATTFSPLLQTGPPAA